MIDQKQIGCLELHRIVSGLIEHGEWYCRFCLSDGAVKPLILHWRDDAPFRESPDYSVDAFLPYCLDCHQAEHGLRKEAEDALIIACGKKLHAFDLLMLAGGVDKEQPVAPTEEVIRALAWAMSQPETLRELVEKFRNRGLHDETEGSL